MSDDICLLVSIANGYLLKVAVKCKKDVFEHEGYLEPDNKEKLMSLLPVHCRSFGEIVDVEEIFEVVDLLARK